MIPHEELKALFAHRKPFDVALDVSGISGQRTTKVDELTESEAQELLNIHSEKLQKNLNISEEAHQKKKLKSKIIAIAEDEGIKESQSWEKFNNWMLSSSVFKKHLNAYSLEELKKLHRQMHALKHNNRRSAKKTMTKAWFRKGVENINRN